MKPLLVGDHPTRAGERYWRQPLSGALARSLCRIADLPGPCWRDSLSAWTQALYEHFECVNAIEHGAWSTPVAAARMSQIIAPSHEVVVLLGERVRDAYVAMGFPSESPVGQISRYEWVIDPTAPGVRREAVMIATPSEIKGSTPPALKRKIATTLGEALEKSGRMTGV